MRILSLYWVTGDVMTGLQYLLVIVMGSVFCVNGMITAGEFIAFVSYNSLLIWPVRMLGRVISEMSKAGISLNRLRYIMNAEEEKEPEGALTPPMDRDIRFENISFSYEGATGGALKDVSFVIPAGSTVGILGGTGSGKSTLMYLLEKLYPLGEGQGRILIGDTDLSKIKSSYVRSQIGMVLQEPYLFSRTIEENIAITKEVVEYAHGKKGVLVVEINAGMMVEDVRLAINGEVPVEQFGRLGGIVPEPEEIVEALKTKLMK